MPTIRINNALAVIMANSPYPGPLTSTSSSYYSIISGGDIAGRTILQIYKGTVASFPSLTSVTARNTDLLISFSLGATATSCLFAAVPNVGYRLQLGIAQVPVAATASGTATWFVLRNAQQTGGSFSDRGAMIGNIGVTGSGADMEIPDTNIVLGQSYRSSGIYITIPYTMVF